MFFFFKISDLTRFHRQIESNLRPIQYGLELDRKFFNMLPNTLQKFVKHKAGVQYRQEIYS
jgi:hypothetical protein